MHYTTAQAAWEATSMEGMKDTVRRLTAASEPLSAEHEHIKAKIRDKEAQIAKLAGEIRWLRMELETA